MRQPRTTFALCLGVLLTALALGSSTESTSIVELLKTKGCFELINKPDRVEACLLALPNANTSEVKEHMLRFDAKYVEAKLQPVPPELQAQIRSVLLREENYRWGFVTGGVPLFQARVKFHQGIHVLALDFCFPGKYLSFAIDGKFVGSALFSEDEDRFLNIIQHAFPNKPSF